MLSRRVSKHSGWKFERDVGPDSTCFTAFTHDEACTQVVIPLRNRWTLDKYTTVINIDNNTLGVTLSRGR